MADTYKELGRVSSSDDAEVLLYSSPQNTSAIASNITVTNTTNEDLTFSIYAYDEPKTQQDLLPVIGTKFLAISAQLETAVSTNGIDWTPLITDYTTVNPLGDDWSNWGNFFPCFVRGLGYYWVMNKDRSPYQIARSADGTSWEIFSPSNDWSTQSDWSYGWIFSEPLQKFFEAPGNANLWVSTDGINYSIDNSFANGTGIGYIGAAFKNKDGYPIILWRSNSGQNKLSFTEDGSSWTISDFGDYPDNVGDLSYGGGIYVATSRNIYTQYSTDLITWTVGASASGTTYTDANNNQQTLSYVGFQRSYYKNGSWYLVPRYANRIFTTQDFLTYSQVLNSSIPTYTYPDSIAISPNYIVMLTEDNPPVLSSTDGINWSAGTLFTNNWDWWPGLVFEGISKYSSPSTKSVFKENLIRPNETKVLEPGIVLGPENSVLVQGSKSGIMFSMNGVEIL